MKTYRSLLIFLFFILLCLPAIQQQRDCPEGGAFVQGIHSGIVKLLNDDLNEGTINKNYFQQIDEGVLSKNKRMSVAFSVVSFEGSGRQGQYSLMIKQYSLENENTRLSIMMDFQYPNSNMLSVWTQISLSYLIVSQNMQKNGFSYVWIYIKDIDLKTSVDSGIIDGDLFNHQNDKNLCGYDGKYWHTDGCKNLEAVSIYHCYVSGWKFNPGGNYGLRQLAFSVQLINKFGQLANDEKEQSLDVIFGKQFGAGPLLQIDNFDSQLQKIKVSLVMSIIQINYPTYPIGTFSITYSGIYLSDTEYFSGQKIIKQQKSNNLYNYPLPGIKYFIYGVSRFIAMKGVPRQASIMLQSEIQAQNAIYLKQNFRLPKNEILFSADFYYKRIEKICQSETELNELQKSQISQMKFQNFPGNQSTYIIRTVNQGDMPQSQHQIAIEYLYHPNQQVEQSSWVTYTFSNIKFGGSYIFYLSINEIGNNGFADYMGYPFVVYVNQQQIYRTTIAGTSVNDKIQGIKKGLNINNDTIQVKIYAKIFRQEQKNINFRVNLLVKQLSKVFNPITQCCNSVCPPESGLNITANPIRCIICDKDKGFYYNKKYEVCSCSKGYYFMKETIFPKCLLCEAALCDMCEPQAPRKCVQCIFGAQLDPYTCKCLPEFKQVQNQCLLNTKVQQVCLKYGYCDRSIFNGLIYKPDSVKCPDGQFDNGQGQCSKCNSQCLTCTNITLCVSCDSKANKVFQNGICICKDGYFQFQHSNQTISCQKCSPQCQKCSLNSQSCTQCDGQKFMQKVATPKGFFTCECIPGYHPDGNGNCLQSNCNADKFCVTCEQNKLCTSCLKSSRRVLQLPQHICVCMVGYFQNSQGECQRCKSGCAQCTSSGNCINCVISAKSNKDGSCLCPKGTYFNFNEQTNIGFCKKCPLTCQSCNDQKTCLTCLPTFTLSTEQNCICPVSKFIENSSKCINCLEGCSQCVSLKNCTKCNDFYRLQQSICVRNCRMGFYKTEKQCFKCGQGCVRCQNSLTCETCEQGFITYQNQCYKQCPEGTVKSPNQTECIPCNSPCKTCLYHPSHCVSCQNGKGFLQQIGDQKKCMSECPIGTYPFNAVCELCDLNCLSCLGDKANCIQCPENRYLFKGKCHAQCPGVLYDGLCINYCPDGHYRFQDKKCQPCSHQCLTCESNPQKCTACRQNLVLKSEKCVKQCHDTQFLKNGKCFQCSKVCKTCFGNEFNCTSCKDKFQMVDGTCIGKCKINEFFSKSQMMCLNCSLGCQKCADDNVCIECQPKFVLINDKCDSSCDYPCQTCLPRKQCKSCITGFYLMEKEKQCVSFCPRGMRAENGRCKCAYGFYFSGSCEITCPISMFGDKLTKYCQHCSITNCVECQSRQICKRCQDRFILSSDQRLCVKQYSQELQKSSCPQGFILQNSNCVKICSQQNFSIFSTPENGTMCVYGNTINKLQQKQMTLNLSYSKTCSQNTFYEDEQCKSKCSIGYFLVFNSQQCKRCKYPCITCKDQDTCQLCKEGFQMVGKSCLSIECHGNMRFFNGKCFNQCPKGTYFDGKICVPICPENHYFYEGFCYLQCPDQSPLMINLACIHVCPIGYLQKGKQCIQ